MLPYSSCHVISFSISLTVGIIAFLLVLFLLGKYRRTPSKIRLVVVIMILLMALAIIIDPITFVISRIVGQTIAQGNYIINLQGGFSFALIALSNILLGYFIHEVFYEKSPRTFVYVIAICEIPLIIILPVFAFLNMDLTLPLTAQLLISLIIYFGEFSAAYHLQKRLSAEHTNKADVRGIQSYWLLRDPIDFNFNMFYWAAIFSSAGSRIHWGVLFLFPLDGYVLAYLRFSSL